MQLKWEQILLEMMQTIDKETTIDYAEKDMFNRKYNK